MPKYIGLMAVIERLELQIPLPSVRSSIIAGARQTRIESGQIIERYPQGYQTSSLLDDFKFALRYEPVDLAVYKAAFRAMDTSLLKSWVEAEPTGRYSRKLWYLYELLAGSKLDVPDAPATGYVDLLNSKIQMTGPPVNVTRQRIRDNLLGVAGYCPHIRLTDALKKWMSEGLDAEAKAIVDNSDPAVLARAVTYLYTSETRSSFALEGERPGRARSERFVNALETASDFDPLQKESFVKLQNRIVDERFAAVGWREMQNYVGQTMPDYSEQVHFVCPKPEDVSSLMSDWMRFVERLQLSTIDPVSMGAMMSFGFVFIHPFDDGNGRIHRFLLHHELARSSYAPENMIFPVSAVILRERAEYDRVLKSFSGPMRQFIEYSLNDRGEMLVTNETADLYRYWDATAFAEFIYRCVAETVRTDLTRALRFLTIFDQAMKAVMDIVDMPDRKGSLLIKSILQNRGVLSNRKRENEFSELTDTEIQLVENAIREIESNSDIEKNLQRK